MTDIDILNIVKKYKYIRYNTIFKQLTNEEKEYIINRYSDTHNYKENLIRIINHIDEVPKCPICGNNCSLTNKNIYGITCGTNYCHRKIISNEIKETCIKNYGVDSILNISYVKEKFKNTWKNHTKQETKNIVNKRKKTSLIKYGVDNKSKLEETKEKMYKTNLERYGHICSAQGKEQKIKSINTSQLLYGTKFPSQSEIVKNKQINTKRKNHTFNTSIPEKESYKLLKEKYPDTKYQYRSELYPFNCDFYIPSLDLYIECNYHWTHGFKPFENTEEDNIKLQQWKNKNTKFYNTAIECWTKRDVNKRNIAKQNNLNYIEFWNINELKNWLND